ncbi:purine-nucleoside phosphorylase [Entomoplasma freundtii]|uniref:Uridine phosphorylase n=1 Tax=Entomoplasma freundtii TaxID=74700 RepID=A0A2K8NRL8_9MOLU|nr:purine-nucleoside phosphorylase [Entomoplasma freundtii]ATZ16502.1 purine nucleoside phosphorylase [Entomoplasma freundtii]TDY56032.1 purine-nucleoside phosphorylase [Entomoplasma freundtii]
MTIHISAKPGEIADFVLMPGDPIRAKVMADKFLQNPVLVNTTRGMAMYTGTYKGVPVTIAASGMGNGSMGIYSYELFQDYGVQNIIRVGTAGAYNPNYKNYAIFNSRDSFGESAYPKIVLGEDKEIIEATPKLFEAIEVTARDLNIPTITGRAHSSDVFYRGDDQMALAKTKGLDVVEMETYSLFTNAQKLHRNAAGLFTISDNLVTGEKTTPEERQNKFDEMFRLALETGVRLNQAKK